MALHDEELSLMQELYEPDQNICKLIRKNDLRFIGTKSKHIINVHTPRIVIIDDPSHDRYAWESKVFINAIMSYA